MEDEDRFEKSECHKNGGFCDILINAKEGTG
jgi:hypothetical protein